MESVFVWSGNFGTAIHKAVYKEARREIAARNISAPKTVKEIDFAEFFENARNALVYFPVFQNSAGWWGQLLGTNAKIRSKIIVSPECQLYEIGGAESPRASRRLFAAELPPRPNVFGKIRESAAAVIKDMIATDNGTVLTLLSADNENKVKSCVKTLGGEFFGTLGGY